MRITGFAAILLIAFLSILAIACQPSPQPSGPADGNGDQTTTLQESQDTETPAAVEEEELEADGEKLGDKEDESGSESFTVDRDDDTIVISDDAGSSLTVRTELPENWPDDIPIMDGFTIVSSSEVEDPDRGMAINVGASGDATPEEVVDFYSNNLPGWNLQSSMTQQMAQTAVVMIFQRDTEMLNITYVLGSEDGYDRNILTLYYTHSE